MPAPKNYKNLLGKKEEKRKSRSSSSNFGGLWPRWPLLLLHQPLENEMLLR
jgi:hypothetical protein